MQKLNICLTLNLTKKMKIYNYEGISECFVYGSIRGNIEKFFNGVIKSLNDKSLVEKHPKEIEREKRLSERRGNIEVDGRRPIGRALIDPHAHSMKRANTFNSSVIIVSSVCGLGSKSNDYYHNYFSKIDKILNMNNCHVLLMRGSSDNPSLFDGNNIDYANIKAIPDYSIIKLKNYSALCIGGGVSLDREWKKTQEGRLGLKMYWSDEKPTYDDDILSIIKNNNIALVVTHCAPTFAWPGSNVLNRSKWVSKNEEIIKDAIESRQTMDRIYSNFMEANKKPYVWYYSQFEGSYQERHSDIIYVSVPSFACKNFGKLMNDEFSIRISKPFRSNESNVDEMPSSSFFKTNMSHNFEEFELEEDLAIDDDEENNVEMNFDVPRYEPMHDRPQEYLDDAINRGIGERIVGNINRIARNGENNGVMPF